jgi:uncharacterized membrane protein
MIQVSTDKELHSLYITTLIVYVLQTIAMFTAIPMIIAVIINYIRLDEARGTWLHSHFRWQIRTFWFGLLFYVISVVLHLILIGYLIGLIVWIWQAYRIAKGWIQLSNHKEMYTH